MKTSINTLRLQNFKNYQNAMFEFHPGFNLIWGKNGMGKTNVLDAIYFISNLKSHSARKDKDLVMHGMDFFRIESSIAFGSKKHNIQIGLDASRKIMSFDEEKIEKRIDWIGKIPVWMISPEDDEIVKEGSAIRRKMLNHLISLLDREYLKDLIFYNRLLKQRNTYLKTTKAYQIDPKFLMTYSEQMNEFSGRIVKKRLEISNDVLPHFDRTYKAISKSDEKVKLHYTSSLIESNLMELHKSSYEKDIALKRTSLGPHRDDWVFTLGDRKLKYFGSQGQKKTFILSVKLALIELYHHKSSKKPILLLDDVFDKIDISRAQGLLECLQDSCIHQVIITDTELERSQYIFEKMKLAYKKYRVENGKLCHEGKK